MLKHSSSAIFRCLLTLLCACSLAPALSAQSNESDLNSRLMDKPLYLRGFWQDDTLHFDLSGKLQGDSRTGSFTLSGFELKTLQLQQDKLILEGRRMGLQLTDNKQRRVPLTVGKVGNLKDESMTIDIAASPTGDYGPALNAIFADGLAEIVPSLPLYWKIYATRNFARSDSSTHSSDATTGTAMKKPAPAQTDPGQQSPDVKPRRIGGGVLPPKLIYSVEPEFSQAARNAKSAGNVLVNLWVSPEGTVSHVSIIRPIGMGLDDRAVEAVQKYTFTPATEDGKPVLVELNIEVNFQIF
jgi:TonB family protein